MNGNNELLNRLHQATHSAQALPALPADALDVYSGYALQRLGLEARQEAGERLSGWKIAFAGRAAQQRFGLDQPVYGALTTPMHVAPGTPVALSRLIQPKLEIEVAIIMGRSLAPGEYRDEDILAAIGAVAPAFEIADCRWQGWAFGAGAFLADNAAAGLYCIGPRTPFDPLLHSGVDYRLECAGALCGEGNTAEREDPPLVNLCWLIRRLLADGQPVEAGQVVLSGALLAPMAIQPTTYRLRMFGTELALVFTVDTVPV
ncbi:fumarylacetoacetate hydrolase family protein [Pseudomonas sp. PDM05]|jgi:2-keto-4-pentenoate hydratase|uniref:2-keto-4-pentenoate hydratase n=1 Tax=Pseudomonas sp. PDM05 TaxID=2769301 RepID=UPI00177E7B95|nr:fumarylacetoacetate hydrolase family protein [Pseudomonas sp. PDM05]MBD9461073.1 fumarylacetoacetate hydrolase family protein [Pseudomonas sp. PDM05]